MATPSTQLDQLIATTLEKIKPQLSDQIFNDLALMAWLNSRSKVGVDGGRTINRPLMYAQNGTVSSYSGYDLIDTTPQGGLGEAIYTWKQLAGSVTIDGLTVRQNSGSAALINLVSTKIEQLRLSIADKFGAMLFGDGTGNSSKDFLGLKAIVSASGVLGGVDSATETFWKSKTIEPPYGATTTPDLTVTAGVKKLNNFVNSLTVAKSKVDVELTTQANFEAYEALSTQFITYTNTKMADLGFQALAHKTAEVVFDAYCPNDNNAVTGGTDGGYWYFLNSDRLEFVQHPDAWLTPTDFVRPANQDAKTMLILCMGNLITDNRRAHGVIKITKT